MIKSSMFNFKINWGMHIKNPNKIDFFDIFREPMKWTHKRINASLPMKTTYLEKCTEEVW